MINSRNCLLSDGYRRDVDAEVVTELLWTDAFMESIEHLKFVWISHVKCKAL